MLVTVTLSEEMASQDPSDRVLDGVLVVADAAEEGTPSCEHCAQECPSHLLTIDESDMVIYTCLPCTFSDSSIESISPREHRDPDVGWQARVGPHLG